MTAQFVSTDPARPGTFSGDQLLLDVDRLKIALQARATGGLGDEGEFIVLRRKLLGITRIAKLLPDYVQKRRDLGEFWMFIQPKFPSYAERREFIRDSFEPLVAMLESTERAPSDETITKAITTLDAAHVREAWQKALERRSEDPEGAITAARTLIESVCKTILDSYGPNLYASGVELPTLYASAANRLNLAPSQHEEQVFKQILGGCQSVVNGLASMRNRLSDAHGQGAKPVRPLVRHAELAVNLAGTMAMFLITTWEERTRPA
jgi:hypothetical protein